MLQDKPTFSIITITYNAEKYVERTIKSIIRQTDHDYEYIIVDGKSKDSTLSIVNNYSEHIDRLISEPDEGIYDAMNKGLKLAKGRFVWFMNAGDEIASPSSISRIKKNLVPKVDLIYSDAIIVKESGKQKGLRSDISPHSLPRVLKWKDFKYGMLVCHQSFIAARQLAPKYDQKNLSADLGYEIEVVKKAKYQLYIEDPLSLYLEGGISVQQHHKSLIDRFKILGLHFGYGNTVVHHFKILLRLIKRNIKPR